MADVVPFARPAPPEIDRHMSGEAFCIACDHRWVAAAPVGAEWLYCAGCGAHKGRFKFECAPPEGAMVRTCKCGCQLFYIRPEGHQCPNCGTYQSYE